jgi:hypothetical protein
MHVYKVYHHISLPLPSSCAISLPPGTIPTQDLFYLTVLHFLKCILIKGIHFGISHMYILFFNQINSLHYFHFLFHPVRLLFNSFQYIILYSIYTQMHCVSLLTLFSVFYWEFLHLCSSKKCSVISVVVIVSFSAFGIRVILAS